MKRYNKVVSIFLILLTTTLTVKANDSIEILLTLAESDPVLLERMNYLAVNEPKVSAAILNLANNNVELLTRLIDLAEINPLALQQVITIEQTREAQSEELLVGTMGGIENDDIIY